MDVHVYIPVQGKGRQGHVSRASRTGRPSQTASNYYRESRMKENRRLRGTMSILHVCPRDCTSRYCLVISPLHSGYPSSPRVPSDSTTCPSVPPQSLSLLSSIADYIERRHHLPGSLSISLHLFQSFPSSCAFSFKLRHADVVLGGLKTQVGKNAL